MVVGGIGRASRCEHDCFGVVVASARPFGELGSEERVVASLLMDYGSVVVAARVRIFRLRLEFGDTPDSATPGGSRGAAIPIRPRFSGFGDVTLRCRCGVGGRAVSCRVPTPGMAQGPGGLSLGAGAPIAVMEEVAGLEAQIVGESARL